MDVTMTYQTQEWWTWWLAVYLYLGGMGAAVLVVAFLSDMYIKPYPRLVLWGALSGIAMLSVGSMMLFGHLLDHFAAIHVLNPLVLFYKPDAWIAWGTQFILWMMIWGLLYALPHIDETKIAHRLPWLKAVWQWPVIGWLTRCCGRYHRFIGWMATINGIGTAVYTGLLLQSFPAVALWHNPGVPLLFTVSAFSTALAYLLIVLNLFNRREEDEALRHFYERLDLMLIAGELVILFSFYHYMKLGSESAMRSWDLLWNDMGWLIGFIGFGLLVPFVLELKGVLKGWASRIPIVAASVLVLVGGYLLRHYFMYAGVYAYPW
jgi:formate-dependent nitrite reductase membrane component NrfD